MNIKDEIAKEVAKTVMAAGEAYGQWLATNYPNPETWTEPWALIQGIQRRNSLLQEIEDAGIEYDAHDSFLWGMLFQRSTMDAARKILKASL